MSEDQGRHYKYFCHTNAKSVMEGITNFFVQIPRNMKPWSLVVLLLGIMYRYTLASAPKYANLGSIHLYPAGVDSRPLRRSHIRQHHTFIFLGHTLRHLSLASSDNGFSKPFCKALEMEIFVPGSCALDMSPPVLFYF